MNTEMRQQNCVGNELALVLDEALGSNRYAWGAYLTSVDGSYEMPFTFTVKTEDDEYVWERKPAGMKYDPETDTIAITYTPGPIDEDHRKFDTGDMAACMIVLIEEGIPFESSTTKNVPYSHEQMVKFIEYILEEVE